jgi:very-short-patch-repair endonuclease
MQLVYLVARAECPGMLSFDDSGMLAEATQHRAKESKDDVSSLLEEQVFKALIEMNGNHATPFERNAWCNKSEHHIDISLRHLSLRINIAIEIDGPSHFIKTAHGAYQLNGETLLRNRLLEGAGWRVLSVQFPHDSVVIDKRKLKSDLLALGWQMQR